jgi:hypothetical protein
MRCSGVLFAAAIAVGCDSPLPGRGVVTVDGGAGGADAALLDANVGPHSEPDIDALPWQTGEGVGFGVASKDSENPMGSNVFIGYAGHAITLVDAQAWVTALYRAKLRDLGVRYLFAVQGPMTPTYAGAEIGNSKIAARLMDGLASLDTDVIVAGHSSGSFVAHELLAQLTNAGEAGHMAAGRVVYFNLDGGGLGLHGEIVEGLHRAYFVGARDLGTGTASPNRAEMVGLGDVYAASGGYVDVDASAAGCAAGAPWCLHMTLITTLPHNPLNADGHADYSDFVGRPVAQAFLDAKAAEAGLE